MFKKFYHKIISSFLLIIVIILVPLLLFFNHHVNHISENHIQGSLELAQDVFRQFNQFRRDSFTEMAHSLIKTHPQIRAMLASTDTEGGEDLFGDGEASGGKEEGKTINEKIFSIVEDLPLFQKGAIFALTDSRGKLLFTKNRKGYFGGQLGHIPLIRAALKGSMQTSWWRSDDEILKESFILPGSLKDLRLFDVFILPVIFKGAGIQGLLIFGQEIGTEDLSLMKRIGNSEVAFFNQDRVYGSTHRFPSSFSFSTFTSQTYDKWKEKDETYIYLRKDLRDSLGQEVASSLVFRPLSKELENYVYLKNVLNLLGLIGMVVATALALIISGTVTKAINVLIAAVRDVRDGNLDQEIVIHSQDEFHHLGQAINDMCRGLKDKESLTRIFKKYMDNKVADNLLAKLGQPEDIRLGGEKRPCVIFFSDIADFTTLSERLRPEEVVEFLNVYLSRMSLLINEGEGIVDKYVGDAIVAYWDGDDPVKSTQLALTVALKQRQALLELRENWRNHEVLRDFDFRIGLHYGEVVIGNIGSESRMNHTIIGDSVNTASRLEGLNKAYSSHIIVSDDIRRQLGKMEGMFYFRKLDWITVKGKTEPMYIHELIDQGPADRFSLLRKLSCFEQGLELYFRGDFLQAKSHFMKYIKEFPEDGAANVFLGRCDECIDSPPDQWNGVYQFKTK